MKKLILALLLAGTLSACGGTGTSGFGIGHKPAPLPEVGEAKAVEMPELPSSLNRRAARLPDLVDGSMKGVQKEGADSDILYNDIAFRLNAVLDAWKCVRTAINSRDTTKMDSCLKK